MKLVLLLLLPRPKMKYYAAVTDIIKRNSLSLLVFLLLTLLLDVEMSLL